jgi:hypothetical protein
MFLEFSVSPGDNEDGRARERYPRPAGHAPCDYASDATFLRQSWKPTFFTACSTALRSMRDKRGSFSLSPSSPTVARHGPWRSGRWSPEGSPAKANRSRKPAFRLKTHRPRNASVIHPPATLAV